MARSCTLQGKPFELAAPELRVGEKAPDATLKRDLLTDFRLGETAGRVRIFSVVPSLDTPVCARQTKRFYEEAAGLPEVGIYAISCDLPTAQARFCGAEGIDPERIVTLSDHKDLSFGRAYGTLIPDLRLLCRAVFVVDRDDTLRYVEYVPEITEQPNYDAVLACVRQL